MGNIIYFLIGFVQLYLMAWQHTNTPNGRYVQSFIASAGISVCIYVTMKLAINDLQGFVVLALGAAFGISVRTWYNGRSKV